MTTVLIFIGAILASVIIASVLVYAAMTWAAKANPDHWNHD
jgi:hypothetical protein